MTEDKQYFKDLQIKSLLFHWMCKPCHCHIVDGYDCVRCTEMKHHEEAFPVQFAWAADAYRAKQFADIVDQIQGEK